MLRDGNLALRLMGLVSRIDWPLSVHALPASIIHLGDLQIAFRRGTRKPKATLVII